MAQEGFTKDNARRFGELFAQKYPRNNKSQTTTSNNNAVSVAANNVTNTPNTSNVPTGSTSRTNQTLNQMQQTINSGFSYDPDNDAALKAARQLAEQQMKRNQVNTNAMLRASGQGKSSWSETVANQIAGDTASRISNELVPHYQNMAYQQYQDRIGNLGNLYSYQNQEDFMNPITEAGITGNYLPGAARQAIQNILDLKRQAESPGVTPEQLRGLSQQADVYRGQLDSMGIDSSQFGADVNEQQARRNMGMGGIPTLEAARMNWDQSPDNPANQAQQLQNQMSELSLQYLPQQLQLEVQQLQQAVNAGELGYQEAQYRLNELMDPNSVTNKLRNLEVEAARLGNVELSKRISQIGRQPALTPQQQRMQQIQLEMAEIELQNAQNPQSNSVKVDAKTSTDNYNVIIDDLDAALTDGILTKETARQLVQANRNNLSDSDYRKALDWVNENL